MYHRHIKATLIPPAIAPNFVLLNKHGTLHVPLCGARTAGPEGPDIGGLPDTPFIRGGLARHVSAVRAEAILGPHHVALAVGVAVADDFPAAEPQVPKLVEDCERCPLV